MNRVLVVGMSSVKGGVEREVLDIIKNCSDSYKFDFLCFGENFDYQSSCPDINFYYVCKRKDNFFKSEKEQERFWIENGYKYSAVWINVSSASNISSHKFAKKYTNAKIISCSHSSKIEHKSILLKWAHIILHLINQKKLVVLSDELIACSKSAAKHLYGKYADMSTVIYNAVDVGFYKYNPRNRERVRKEIGFNDKDILLICVGRAEKVKNFIYAIKVYQSLKKTSSVINYKMLILGDGSEMDNIKKYIKQHEIKEVHLLGFVDKVKPYLDAADVLLLPSLFEGFPVSIIEAQANGLACLVSDKITREVRVTDLVKFIGIDKKDVLKWKKAVQDIAVQRNRIEYNVKLQNSKYDKPFVVREMKKILHNDGDSQIVK